MAESVSVQMNKIIDEYTRRVKNANRAAIQRVGRETANKLKSASPRKSGKYASGWRVKKIKDGGDVVDVVVHNVNAPGLTHLLENGHVVRNKKGTFGRAPAHKHIKPVEEWANNELPLEIERELL